MKVLSIEQKAKAYDEALSKVKQLIEDDPEAPWTNNDILYIFPELKESEDERIRNNCIHFLNLQKQHHASVVEIDECIAWLEKQGEQKGE